MSTGFIIPATGRLPPPLHNTQMQKLFLVVPDDSGNFARPHLARGPAIFLTERGRLLSFCRCLTSSAYPEWPRGQARRRHSNLVHVPRC